MASLKSLQEWCILVCKDYPNVDIQNMTTSFRDGLAYCAIIHKHRPDLIDFHSLSKDSIYENNCLAFEVAESELGIPALLDPEDMVSTEVPDRLGVITYLSQYYNFFNRKPHASSFGLKKLMKSDLTTEQPRDIKQHKFISPGGFGGVEDESQSKKPSNICRVCQKHVHLVQRVLVKGKLFHRICFRCSRCSCMLQPGSYKEGSETGSLVCFHPCLQSQNGIQASPQSSSLQSQITAQDVVPPLNCPPNQLNPNHSRTTYPGNFMESAGRRERNKVESLRHESTDRQQKPPPTSSSCRETRMSQGSEEQEIVEAATLCETKTAKQAVEAPVPAPRRHVDPSLPRPAPRTKRTTERSRPSDCGSSERRKALSPPWMELIQPGPWAKLPPAPAPTPPPRSCSIPSLSDVWLRHWASPFNPFEEEDEEEQKAEKERREDGTFRAVLERDENQIPLPTVLTSQSWCGASHLAEAVRLSNPVNQSLVGRSPNNEGAKTDHVLIEPSSVERDSTFEFANAASPLDESNSHLPSSHSEACLAEAVGFATSVGVGVSDSAELTSSCSMPILAETASTLGVSSLNGVGSALQSERPGSASSYLLAVSECLEGSSIKEHHLPQSISEPVISAACNELPLTDCPTPSNQSNDGMKKGSSAPSSTLKDGSSSSSCTPIYTKRMRKENPFNRKASPPEEPKPRPRPNPGPNSTRVSAPGHGFPLIKRKVQSDQYVPRDKLQEEMGELEKRLLKLELQGVEMERSLRNCHSGADEEDMLVNWFTLIHEKHMLVRRDAELVYMVKQQNLEERQADVEYELRCLLNRPERDWSKDDKLREKELMESLVAIIEERNHIITSMDQDRLREKEEDMLLEAMIKRKDFHRQSEKEQWTLAGRLLPRTLLKRLGPRADSRKAKSERAHTKKS